MGGREGNGLGSPEATKAAKAVGFAILRYSGVAFAVRHLAQEGRVTILGYHDPDPLVFELHLAVLTSIYSVIPLDTYLAARRAGDVDSLPARSLVVTLDDGWAGNVRLLPALKRHAVRPTVFISTSIVGTGRHYWWTHAEDEARRERLKLASEDERLRDLAMYGYAPENDYPDRQALSIEELVEMGPWVDFQSHSRTHPILPRCTDDRAEEEIAGSAEDMERLTGARPRAFAYPNGDYTEREIGLLRQAGYECAITIEPGYNGATSDPYRLKRIIIGDDASITELIARASGVYGVTVSAIRRLLAGATHRLTAVTRPDSDELPVAHVTDDTGGVSDNNGPGGDVTGHDASRTDHRA